MNTGSDDEKSHTGPALFSELVREPGEMKPFELLLKIERRLRKEARDDLRAQKELS
jgi:hypothetical protein